ncbi:MAG: helicase HerA-like domain-containing protein, partial [Pseudomonadota bacterium]|nr:helicase HerA-like domain-containing protein [Pseudomonadota bacterium]
ITEMKVGVARVSLLQEDGAPGIVQRTLIAPPRSRLAPIDPKERAIIQSTSPYAGKYDDAVNRESAEEILAARAEAAAAAAQAQKAEAEAEKAAAAQAKLEAKQREAELKRQAREAARPSNFDRAVQSATRSAASSVGRQVANELGRAVFGGSSRRKASGGIAGRLVRGLLGGLFK